jgi:hypothetical protein
MSFLACSSAHSTYNFLPGHNLSIMRSTVQVLVRLSHSCVMAVRDSMGQIEYRMQSRNVYTKRHKQNALRT